MIVAGAPYAMLPTLVLSQWDLMYSMISLTANNEPIHSTHLMFNVYMLDVHGPIVTILSQLAV